MALYQDGKLVSGANVIPQMTLAEYNALPSDKKPTYWERTDADYDDYCVKKSGDTMTGNLYIDKADGTASVLGASSLVLGNTTPSGTAGNSRGQLFLYGEGANYGRLRASNVTANRNIELPDKAGTIALTSDLTPVNIKSNYNVSGIQSLYKIGNIIEASIEVTPSSITHGTVLIEKLPSPIGGVRYLSLGMANGQVIPCSITTVSGQDYAQLIAYYPTGSQTPARIDATITYFSNT